MASYIPQLGKIINPDDDLANKDAIHIAVLPVLAGEPLKAGDKVRLKLKKVFEGTFDEIEDEYEDEDYSDILYYVYKSNTDIIGIIDPFLNEEVIINDKIWLCILPNTVENLRHDWEHKLIPSNYNIGYEKGYDEGYEAERCPC